MSFSIDLTFPKLIETLRSTTQIVKHIVKVEISSRCFSKIESILHGQLAHQINDVNSKLVIREKAILTEQDFPYAHD